MFIIWYSLLGFIKLIFFILSFLSKLLKLDITILHIFENFVQNKLSQTNNSNAINSIEANINFKNLYSEYKFFNSKDSKLTLRQNILNNYLNNKTLNNTTGNYLYFNNFYFNVLNKNTNVNNVNKLNLNYFNNTLKLFNNNNTLLKYKSQYLNNIKSNLSNVKVNLVNVSNTLENKISNTWTIKYSPSNFMKYIGLSNFQNYTILFLRKNKVFNKGRYSRNRQYYRTGVYWCLYINIVAVIGIHFWFYKLTMNFGYLWWLLYIFILSFLVPKILKYRLYNIYNLLNNLVLNFIWIYLILLNYVNSIFNLVNKYNFNKKLLNSNFFFLNASNIFINFYSSLLFLFNNKYINLYEYNYINTYYSSNSYFANLQFSLNKFIGSFLKI